jgi:RNA polymerase sigma-70 factor (ECF subfamily)
MMKAMPKSEDRWLDGARRLEEEALSAIYDAYSPALYRYAYRLLGDPQASDDVVAETFYRLIRAISSGGGPEDNLKAYLYRVAHNLVMDTYRGNRELVEDADIGSLPLRADELSPEAEVISDVEGERARQMLWLLTDDQRQVIVLKFYEGLTNQEVATSLEKPVGAVKSLQHRALQSLRRIYEREDHGSENNGQA